MKSEPDSPWRRLPWTMASALLAWVILLWAFGEFLSRPDKFVPPQKPIDAKLIEIPPLPKPEERKPQAAKTAKPEPVRKKAEVPKVRTDVRPKAEAPPEVRQPAETMPRPKATPEVRQPAETMPPPKAEASVPRQQDTPGGEEMGARAIYSPKPQIPDEFRRDSMDFLIVARFYVSAEGEAKVELTTATPIPGLNRSILDTLKTWKFFPAMREGKPVASIQDVRFRLRVK